MAIASVSSGVLHAGLHADDIGDHAAGQAALRSTTKLTVRIRLAVDASQGRLRAAARPARACADRSRGRRAVSSGIGEGEVLGLALDEEVEGLIDRHVGDEIDLDLQLGHRLGKDEAGQIVAVGVLLPVHEMLAGVTFSEWLFTLVAECGAGLQPDDLGPERDRAVIFVMGEVVDSGLDRHDCQPDRFLNAFGANHSTNGCAAPPVSGLLHRRRGLTDPPAAASSAAPSFEMFQGVIRDGKAHPFHWRLGQGRAPCRAVPDRQGL
jgi:hypothetical protein